MRSLLCFFKNCNKNFSRESSFLLYAAENCGVYVMLSFGCLSKKKHEYFTNKVWKIVGPGHIKVCKNRRAFFLNASRSLPQLLKKSSNNRVCREWIKAHFNVFRSRCNFVRDQNPSSSISDRSFSVIDARQGHNYCAFHKHTKNIFVNIFVSSC